MVKHQCKHTGLTKTLEAKKCPHCGLTLPASFESKYKIAQIDRKQFREDTGIMKDEHIEERQKARRVVRNNAVKSAR